MLGKTGPPGPISNINLYNQNNAESSARRECEATRACFLGIGSGHVGGGGGGSGDGGGVCGEEGGGGWCDGGGGWWWLWGRVVVMVVGRKVGVAVVVRFGCGWEGEGGGEGGGVGEGGGCGPDMLEE